MDSMIKSIANQDKHIFGESYSVLPVYPALFLSAKLKSQPEDFIVEENISIDFSGDGEHCWLYIKKRGCNTDWVAQQLAKYCGIKKMAVSYAGLKDRHALTSQWFSVQLPGKPTPDWSAFEVGFSAHSASIHGSSAHSPTVHGSSIQSSGETVQVEKCYRHNRKLQRGALKSNRFIITLRDLNDCSDHSFELLQLRCKDIAKQGVANYFGPQRFGINNNNLAQSVKFFSNRGLRLSKHKRGLYLSAARSWLFNRILSERVRCDIWNKRLPGDVFMLDGKSACFKDDTADDKQELNNRLEKNEIHPTAALWGEGDRMVTVESAALESQIIDQVPIFRDGLTSARMQAQRRACRVVPSQFENYRQGDNFVLSFSLPPGSYATTVLSEIVSSR